MDFSNKKLPCQVVQQIRYPISSHAFPRVLMAINWCACVCVSHISGQAQIILVAKYDISPFGHYIPINSDRLIP